MDEIKLRKIFKETRMNVAPRELKGVVLAEIKEIKRKKGVQRIMLRRILGVFETLLVFGLLLAGGWGFLSSDFWVLAKLLFSDVSLVFGYWQEFGLSLLENFPVFPTAAFLLGLSLAFFLASFYFKNISRDNLNYS